MISMTGINKRYCRMFKKKKEKRSKEQKQKCGCEEKKEKPIVYMYLC